MADDAQEDLPTLVSALQAASIEWAAPPLQTALLLPSRVSVGSTTSSSGSGGGSRYSRYAQALADIEELFAAYQARPTAALVSWCASLHECAVATRLVDLLCQHIVCGSLSYVLLQRCLRLVDVFLGWTTRPNAGAADDTGAGVRCPALVPSHAMVRWVESTWTTVMSPARDGVGAPLASASLCGALQLLPILLRWSSAGWSMPPLRRAQLPPSGGATPVEARLVTLEVLPALLMHQQRGAAAAQASAEALEYVRRACSRTNELSVRLAAGAALRRLLEVGLRIASPAVAYALMDTLLAVCDEASLYDGADDELHDVGTAMGYLLAFYQCDFTADTLADVLHAVAASTSKSAAHERAAHRGGGGGSGGGCGGVVCHVQWQFFGGLDAVEGSRVVQRCFNECMTRASQRGLATALATLCSCCATPATTGDALRCCFVLLVPFAQDARAYMPRLLADAIAQWAVRLPSNGSRVVLADVLRGYVQGSGEDKAVTRTAMVALQGVARTLSSSLEIGFNIAEDVMAAVQRAPNLLHCGVEVLAAVARTNRLYARHLQHQCTRVDGVDMANTLRFQLQVRALLEAAAATATTTHRGTSAPSAGREDALVHACLRLLLRLSGGHPPSVLHDVHYRQGELVFRLAHLLYDLLRGSAATAVEAMRHELQPCTLGFMNLLASSPATSIAYSKAAAAACAMLRRAPVASDTERLLAIALLESRVDTTAAAAASPSTAATAHYTLSRGALYDLIASRPWHTCRDDGSVRWLARQALKDIAAACAIGAAVASLADVCGAAVAAAASSMRLLRADLCISTSSSGIASATAAETPTHAVEECGGHAVRLYRWTLRHLLGRVGGADACVALLASVRTELFDVYGRPPAETIAAAASMTAEDAARRSRQHDTGMWNSLCVAEQLLREASPRTAAALWRHSGWMAEVRRWSALAAQLMSTTSSTGVEVKLVAAKVHGRCIALCGEVDAYTSQALSAVALGMVGKEVQTDALGTLMSLSEAHSCYGELVEAAPAVRADADSCPTLPLATSLLAKAWEQVASAAPTAVPAPLLLLLSLRLASVYPLAVEAALADPLAAVLLAPSTAANRLWWTPESALGVHVAVQLMWNALPGGGTGARAVRHSTALALLQDSCAVVLQGQRTSAAAAVPAALDAVHAYTLSQQQQQQQQHQQQGSVHAIPGDAAARRVSWAELLHQSLNQHTAAPPEEVSASAAAVAARVRLPSTTPHRRVVLDDGAARRIASLWSAAVQCHTARVLGPVDVAVQVDIAATAGTREAWAAVAESMHTAAAASPAALETYMDGVRAVLQARPPDVQVDVAKRDSDMFAAVEEAEGAAGAGNAVRGDSGDDVAAEDYDDALGDDATGGGILSEAGGAADVGDGGPRTAEPERDAGVGRATGAASGAVVDVAAKEAAMWWLHSVLRSIARSRGDTDTDADASVRRALLPTVVAAAQLVEVHPEVQLATIAVLHEVLVAWGGAAARRDGDHRHTPALLQWRTQLVVGLTTVLEHGLVSLERCAALAVQYSRSTLADPSSCRRVLRTLLLLLHACHRLHERRRDFLLDSGCGAGYVAVVVAVVAQSPAAGMDGGEGDAADGAACESGLRALLLQPLASAPSQAAVALLCERLVAAASLVNGYAPSAGATSPNWRGGGGGGDGAGDEEDDDDDGGAAAAAASSVYGPRVPVSAGDVLQAVASLTREPLKATLGPALRYAAGCLAVLTLATLELPAANTDAAPSAAANALASVAALTSDLSASHQRLLARLAHERLRRRTDTWQQQQQQVWGATEANLMRIVAMVPLSPSTAAALLGHLSPVLMDGAVAEERRSELVASLLLTGVSAGVALPLLLPLLRSTTAEALLLTAPPVVLRRLHHAVGVYVREGPPARAHAFAAASPVGLLLAEHCAAHDRWVDGHPSALLVRTAWPSALRLLQEASDPVRVVAAVWDGAATPLRELVPHHRASAEALLAVLASLGTRAAAPEEHGGDSGSEEVAVLAVLRCRALMCELLLGTVAPLPLPPGVDALHAVLTYVLAVLATPRGAAFSVALKAVGEYLVRHVVQSADTALREAIRRLGPAKAAELRSFMEAACA